jgi:N-acetylglucosaminyl-diphospho-decaprenol L-rhamnosyltransferase
MELSIIIVNWNTRDLVAKCLDSIYAYPPNCNFDIWVVDNASSDGSAQTVRERFSNVRLIENRENLGFARANNQVIRESVGAHLLFINSDTVIQSDALSRLFAFAHTHPQAGVVGAFLLNRDETPQYSYSNFPSIWSETACAFGLDSRFPFSIWFAPPRDSAEDWVRRDCVPGAAFMIKRSVLDAVGFFDEQFFMYSEEVDLQLRVKKAGWENYIIRSARIIHLGGASIRQSAAAMKAELFRSKVYYFRKHHNPISAFVLRWVFKTSILGRILKCYLRGNASEREMWKGVWKHFGMNKFTDAISSHETGDSLAVAA